MKNESLQHFITFASELGSLALLFFLSGVLGVALETIDPLPDSWVKPLAITMSMAMYMSCKSTKKN